jgi:nucleoside permease NupC
MHNYIPAHVHVTFQLQSESALLFKPFIKDLTRSEVHALMAEGFATVAGMLKINNPG